MMLRKILLRVIPFLFIQNALALNLQGYQFSNSFRYALLEDSFMENFDGRYVGTLSYGHVNSPFYYSDSYLHDMRGEIIDSNNILTAGFTWYASNNISIGADTSVINNKVFGDTHTTLADTIIKSRVNILKQKTFSLSLNPRVYLPTGDEDNFSSMGSLGGALSVVTEKALSRIHLLASVGALSARDNKYADVDHRQLLLTQLGVSYDLSEVWKVNLESYRNFPLVNDTLQDEGKYFLTGRHATHKNVTTFFGAGVSGQGEVQRNTYSGFIGIKIHESSIVETPVAVRASAPQRQAIRPDENIYFSHDRYHLEEEEKEKLEEYATFLLQENKEEDFVLEGHASSIGPSEYNMILSRKRAETVRNYLLNQGVSAKRISIEAFGETAPQDKEVWKNRNVHFNFKQQD
ncbi:MAG: OmpA family protein [Bacteriovoracia bacterium]